MISISGNLDHAESAQPLMLKLLGPVRISSHGKLIESGLWAKSIALLAYLASEDAIVHRREGLAELIWPDKTRTASLTNLRQAISQLHNSIPSLDEYLHITPQTVQFNPDRHESLDTTRFLNLVAQCDRHVHVIRGDCAQCVKRLEQALELYRGRFMNDFYIKDSSEFETWLEMKRQFYDQIVFSMLSDIAEFHLKDDQFEIAQQSALRQVEMDPYRESAHRQLMRALAACGLRSAAITHYNQFKQRLNNDLGISPEIETSLLFDHIRQDDQNDSGRNRPSESSRSSISDGYPDFQQKTVFVGRKKELTFIQDRFHEALNGKGQIVLVSGEAGWGKTALIDAFVEQARAARPNVICAYGKGSAYTGIGDPYKPFRDILGFLTGDVETRWAAGTITQDLAFRVWKLFPDVAQSILENGEGLIDVFISRQALVNRLKEGLSNAKATNSDQEQRLKLLLRQAEAQPAALAPINQKNLFEQYTKVLMKIADQTPLVLVLDDMQWMDFGSVSLLHQLGKQLVKSRIFLIGAYRPLDLRLSRSQPQTDRFVDVGWEPAEMDIKDRHPLEYVINEMKRDRGNIEISLTQGEEGFTDALIDSVPNLIGGTFRSEFQNRTRGHPLFAVELLQSIMAIGGLVKDRSGRLVEGDLLNWDVIPARIEALIIERLGRLPKRLLNILKAACVEGEYFTAEIIAAALKTSEDEIIQVLSDEIAKEHRLISPETLQWQQDGKRVSKYRFDHILLQKYLYASLDPIERSVWHARIATAIETHFSENAVGLSIPLSWHFENAGDKLKAIHYLKIAGEKALNLSANHEGMAHFTRALDLLATLPTSDAIIQLKLSLQINLAVAIHAFKGYADDSVGQAFGDAYETSKLIGDTRQAFPIIWQLASFRSSLADFSGGAAMMQDLIELAERIEDPLLIALGQWGMGWSKFWIGDYVSSQRHLAHMIEYYDPARHSHLVYAYSQDPGVTSRAVLALDQFALGYADQAAETIQSAVELARKINHPLSLALALAHAGMLLGFSNQFLKLQKNAEDLIQVTEKNEITYWYSAGLHQKGLALCYLGDAQKGIKILYQALGILQASKAVPGQEVLCMNLAEVLSQNKKAGEGLELINQQIALSQRSGAFFFMPEQIRVRAEVLLAHGPAMEELAEMAFLESINLARKQSARFLELKSSLGLSRLWSRQGKADQARLLLNNIYSWFTEGFDLPDMQAARQLILEMKQR